MYGQDVDIGLCFQNSFGTNLTNSVYWIPMLNEDVGVGKPPLISQTMRGIFEEGEHYEGANMVDGSINVEINPITIGALFKAMMGAPSTSGSGKYTHVFKPAATDWDNKSAKPPFTAPIIFGDTGSGYQFYDLNIATMELVISNGEFLTANFGVIGGSYVKGVTGTPSYPTDDEFTWNTTSISIAGAGNDDVQSLTITLDDSIEAKHTMNNSLFPSRVKRNGFRTLNISGTILFDDHTEYEAFLAQSERNLTVTFTNSSSDVIEMIVPLARYTEFKPMGSGAGEQEVSFSSKGVYSVTSATLLQITLINDQATY